MSDNETYMYRCLQLAKPGAGYTAPNPLVGAVLVYDGRIIGEGYHQQYGQAHAEVNCINSVKDAEKDLITDSVLYVSLEPCAHHGKTPPCADLIIKHKIKNVVIGCRDPFAAVDGKGIEKLNAAGIHVTVGIAEEQCKLLNKRFFNFHTKQRPYIILKWAQTADCKMATADKRLHITNQFTNRLVHKWRSEEMGILVGTNTALQDDPELTNRLWSGNSPVRLVVDRYLRLPLTLKIFNQQQKTIIFNTVKQEQDGNILYFKIDDDKSIIQQIMNACFKENIISILVEGGAKLLQSFIDEGLWDEARIITNETMHIDNGLAAPKIADFTLVQSENIFTDRIDYFYNNVLL